MTKARGRRSPRRPLVEEMLRRHLAADHQDATELVLAGRVRVGGSYAKTPQRMVAAHESLSIDAPPPRFVSRAGDKLDNALAAFAVSVEGRRCLDIGASTGGFTDCLLQRGASNVVAVDVGRAQAHDRVQRDPRTVWFERLHAKHIERTHLGGNIDLMVVDVSFCSVVSVLEPAIEYLAEDADLVVLVKPQFEAPRSAVADTAGVIRSPEVWEATIRSVGVELAARGWAIRGVSLAEPAGRSGNAEFFVHATRSADAAEEVPLDIRPALEAALERQALASA